MEEIKRVKSQFADVALPMKAEIKSLIKEHGDKIVGEVTLAQLFGGMRGVKSLVTETSHPYPFSRINCVIAVWMFALLQSKSPNLALQSPALALVANNDDAKKAERTNFFKNFIKLSP